MRPLVWLVLWSLVACGEPGEISDPASGQATTQVSSPMPGPASSGGTSTSSASLTSSALWADHCPCPEAYLAERIVETPLGSNMVVRYAPPAFERDRLVIFLHGTSQSAASHVNILRTAAFAGFHVVAVTYENAIGGSVCMDHYADELDWCIEELRRGRLYGAEHPGVVQVSDDQSIAGLVWKALREAHAAEPDAGWDQYYDEADPVTTTAHEALLHWDQAVIGGFSQGASVAGFAAHDQPLMGAFLVSGPMDATSAWQLAPHLTLLDNWVAFVHEREAQNEPITTSLARLGVSDSLTDVEPLDQGACEDAPWPPYGDARGFVCALPGAAEACDSGDPAHGSMGTDECMNLDDAPAGDPYALFRPYLAGICLAAG